MPPVALSLPKKPLVDTNILFDFLLWRFSVENGMNVERLPLGPLRPTPLREPLLWYLDRAKPIQTSPHVIAEIHGLLKSRAGWKGVRLESFWGFAQAELVRLGLEEDLVKVTEMESETLRSLGPTDTAIVVLAAKLGSVVFTEDGELRGWCAKQEIGLLNCSDGLALWQVHTA